MVPTPSCRPSSLPLALGLGLALTLALALALTLALTLTLTPTLVQDEFGDSPLSLAQRASGRDALVALLLDGA